MPKTKKKVTTSKNSKATVRKTVVKKVTTIKPVKSLSNKSSFSPEFTNAMLVLFAIGMMVFAYVIVKLYR